MKLLKTTVVAGLLAASGAASALNFGSSFGSSTGIALTGNVALTTDYIWRGMSQTAGAPAIQGGFDADLGNGVYAGVWGSNVDSEIYEDASMELDIYAGWAKEINGVGVDLGVIHFAYPTSNDENDWTEVYVGLSMGPVSLTQYFAVDLGSDDIGDYRAGNYTDLNIDLGSYNGVSFSTHVGYYDLQLGSDDYWDWKVAASKNILGVNMEVAYTDVDTNSNHNGSGRTTADDAAWVLTASLPL